MAREAWTDERLDEFKENVNQRFDEVGKRFDRVEADIRESRSEMKKGFERVDRKFEALQSEMNARFDSMQRTMIVCFTGMTASIVASVIGAVLLG